MEDMQVPQEIFVGKSVEVAVAVRNEGASEVKAISVVFSSEDGFTDKEQISLNSKGRDKVIFNWSAKKEGMQTVKARVEVKDDAKPGNNEMKKKVEVKNVEEKPVISLGKFAVAGLKDDLLAPGKPLVVLLEIDSSAELEKPLDAFFSLKGKENSQEFKEEIKGLKKGKNHFKWELSKEPKPDKYRLNVEASCSEIKYREKVLVEFVVTEEEK